MMMYTRSPHELVRPVAWLRQALADRQARLVAALLVGLCASCSDLWQPYIENFDLLCSDSSTPCPRGPDMLPPPAPPDLSGPGCPAAGAMQVVKQQVGSSYFRGIWGTDAAHVWAVGDGGTIAKWNGNAWTMQTTTPKRSLFAVWGSGSDFLVAVGESGTVFTSPDGSSWTLRPVGIPDTIYGIWGNSQNNMWVGGNTAKGGFIAHWDGIIIQNSPTTGGVSSLWGKDTNVWATGGGGNIVKWDGKAAWLVQQSGTKSGLPGVWGIDAQQIWAVGDAGTILKWNGTVWTPQDSHIGTPLFAVWGIDACNIWAVGTSGGIVRWNGVSWSPQPSNTNVELVSVWGSDARDLWVGGAAGTLLHIVPQ